MTLLTTRPAFAFALGWAAATGPACQETTSEPTPPLAIECSAVPASGPAPLTVAFVLQVRNAVGTPSYSLSFGDGTTATDPDGRHVYRAAGDYVASITVDAGGQSARCSVPIAVGPGVAPTPGPVEENRWPDPFFRTNPAALGGTISGRAPLFVRFNLCQSQDPDGDGLFFRFDLDGDGAYEHVGTTGADCSREATYAVGTRTATICVADGDCPSWPLCEDLPRWRFHPYQCASYTVSATP